MDHQSACPLTSLMVRSVGSPSGGGKIPPMAFSPAFSPQQSWADPVVMRGRRLGLSKRSSCAVESYGCDYIWPRRRRRGAGLSGPGHWEGFCSFRWEDANGSGKEDLTHYTSIQGGLPQVRWDCDAFRITGLEQCSLQTGYWSWLELRATNYLNFLSGGGDW